MKHLSKRLLIELAMCSESSLEERYMVARELQKRAKRPPTHRFNPAIHTRHKKKITFAEKVYMCKFHDIDGLESLSYALGRSELTIARRITDYQNQGKYWFYKNCPFNGFQEDELGVTG